MSIAVLIAGDHELRSGLRGVLERNGFSIAAEARTPREAVTYALEPNVQVVLLHPSWANCTDVGRDGEVSLLRSIRRARPSLPVLMYSVEAGSVCIEGCRRAGANGHVTTGLDDAVLRWAVCALHAGEQIWPESQHAGPLVQVARRVAHAAQGGRLRHDGRRLAARSVTGPRASMYRSPTNTCKTTKPASM